MGSKMAGVAINIRISEVPWKYMSFRGKIVTFNENGTYTVRYDLDGMKALRPKSDQTIVQAKEVTIINPVTRTVDYTATLEPRVPGEAATECRTGQVLEHPGPGPFPDSG